MKKIGFIVDSSSGIKNGEYPDVYVLPLAVTLKDKNDKSKITILKDGINCDEVKIAQLIKDDQDICTSQASIGEIVEIIEDIYDKYDRIYAIPIAVKLSQSFNTWKLVAEDYPKVLPICQNDVAIGARWSIEDILEMKKNDQLNDDSIQQYFDKVKDKRCALLTVYDVKQLKKGGRVSNFKSMIINMLGLKLCITLDKNGLCYYGKASNLKKAIDVAFEAYKERIINFDLKNIKRVGFIYSPTHEHEEDVREALEDYLIAKKLQGVEYKLYKGLVPGVICAHTGPYCFAVYVDCE